MPMVLLTLVFGTLMLGRPLPAVRRFWRPAAAEKELVLAAKICVVLMMTLAVVIAFFLTFVVCFAFAGTVAGGRLQAGDDATEAVLFARDELPDDVAFSTHRRILDEHFLRDRGHGRKCP